MADEPFYSPNRKPPAARTERTVGEMLWEVHVDHVFWHAELFDEQAYGFDVRLFRDAEFFGSQRWANREAAIAWANEANAGPSRRAGPNEPTRPNRLRSVRSGVRGYRRLRVLW